MTDLTLVGLKSRVETNALKLREKQKASYQLARSLGFTGNEAVILQNHSEATIRRLADERVT